MNFVDLKHTIKNSLDAQKILGKDSDAFFYELIYKNFTRSRIILNVILVIFFALLALDIFRWVDGIWLSNPGYKVLFFAHCSIIALLIISLILVWLNPLQGPDQVRPFHKTLINAAVFMVLLNMIPISIGDILISGSMVAYLGALFTLAALFVMTNFYSLMLYLVNMVAMVISLGVVSWQFKLPLEILIINAICFSLIAFVLSRILYFQDLKLYKSQLLIEKQQRELQDLAAKDPLTNAFNRRKLQEFLEIELSRSNRHLRPLSIMIFDIDHFKKVNDQYGHTAGDIVLVDLTQVVRSHLRKADIFARWGGEEFIVVSPETNLEEMRKTAEKIRTLIQNHTPLSAPSVTASFGITDYVFEESTEALIKRADQALYRAKENGRNRSESIAGR